MDKHPTSEREDDVAGDRSKDNESGDRKADSGEGQRDQTDEDRDRNGFSPHPTRPSQADRDAGDLDAKRRQSNR